MQNLPQFYTGEVYPREPEQDHDYRRLWLQYRLQEIGFSDALKGANANITDPELAAFLGELGPSLNASGKDRQTAKSRQYHAMVAGSIALRTGKNAADLRSLVLEAAHDDTDGKLQLEAKKALAPVEPMLERQLRRPLKFRQEPIVRECC